MRDFMAGERQGEFTLFPYAKDLFYHPDQKVLSMTVQMYDETQTHEFSFGFKVHPQLERFLDRTVGEEEY
jgi:hypothetical protein